MALLRLVVASSLVLASGCSGGVQGADGGDGEGGDGPAPIPIASTFGAGSRLVPRVADGGDGAVVFRDFLDTELGVPCTFEDTADGLRCVPRGLTMAFPGAMFLDGSCEEPAVEVSVCNEERLAPFYDLNDTCRGPVATEVFVGGEDTVDALGSVQAYQACSESDGMRTLRPATRMPLDRLVAGTIEVEAVAGDLGVRRLVGADGSFAVLGLTRAGHPCTPTEVDGVERCVDDVLALSAAYDGRLPLYADASCTTEAAMVGHLPGCTSETPALAVRAIVDDAYCVVDRRFHAVDGTVDGVYSDAGGTCGGAYSENELLVRLGDELPAAALPAVETGWSGSGRLRAAVRTVDGEAVFADAAAFEDTAMGTACMPRPIAGGELRCIPGGAIDRPLQGEALFADPECGDALYPTPRAYPAGCAEAPRFTPLRANVSCGDLVGEVLERGDLHEGAVYVMDLHVGCVAAENPGNVHVIAARHPVDAFAPLEVHAAE